MDDPVGKIRGIQDSLLKQIKKFLVNTLPDKNLPNQNLDFLAYMHFIISIYIGIFLSSIKKLEFR